MNFLLGRRLAKPIVSTSFRHVGTRMLWEKMFALVVRPSVCRPSVCPTIGPSSHLSSCRSVWLSVRPFICPSSHLSVQLSGRLAVWPSIHLAVQPFVCLHVGPPVGAAVVDAVLALCLSVRPSVRSLTPSCRCVSR